jgi:hypothetical protein
MNNTKFVDVFRLPRNFLIRVKNKLYTSGTNLLYYLIVHSTKQKFSNLNEFIALPNQKFGERQRGILITTFEKRQFTSALPLVKQIRDAGIQYPICIFLNGNLNRDHNSEARSKFLHEISKLQDVGVITNFEMSGLARNWNLGIQILGTELTACFNDDLIVTKQFKKELDMVYEAADVAGLITIIGFSAFVLSRKLIDKIGWFDERFLGIGDEDGDYVWRFIDNFGYEPPSFKSYGLIHEYLQTKGDEIAGVSKYSLFNLVWNRIKYVEDANGVKGCFASPHSQSVTDMQYHPMETFRRKYKFLLREDDEHKIRDSILQIHEEIGFNPNKSVN